LRDKLWENTNLVNKSFPINVFHIRSEGNQPLYLHWHEHLEIILLHKGNTVFYINGTKTPVSEGDIIFVNSGELHAAYRDEPHSVEYKAVVFHPSLLDSLNNSTRTVEWISPFVSGSIRFTNVIRPQHEHYAVVQDSVTSLIEEFQSKPAGYEFAVRAHCQLICTWLSRWFAIKQNNEHQLDVFKQKAERFKELLNYVGDHYMEKITIKQAAAIVHLSPYHFCKVFKKMTGSTFIQFVNLQRIYEAERLLKHTTLTVTEIAENLGYGSINHFTKIFRKHKGCPPTKMRI
jgi:AraC family transcriptional activator of pobA